MMRYSVLRGCGRRKAWRWRWRCERRDLLSARFGTRRLLRKDPCRQDRKCLNLARSRPRGQVHHVGWSRRERAFSQWSCWRRACSRQSRKIVAAAFPAATSRSFRDWNLAVHRTKPYASGILPHVAGASLVSYLAGHESAAHVLGHNLVSSP